ncbi:unnamed protein product, partial [Coregonus sp. 'balchen']
METHCDATLDGAQCYGALGGTVSLQLMTIDSKVPDILLKTISTGVTKIILKIRNKTDKKVKIHKSIETRAHFFFNNGTFRIDNTERSDSTEYRLETFNSDGETIRTRRLQLFIEAPVSSLQLSSQCLTHGEMRVTCSSEGDGPQYSWTLDGHTQRDTEASPGDQTNTMTLKRGLSGDLTCTVKNHISSVTVSKKISPCEGLMYVNCTSNGTKISEWVIATGHTLCIDTTAVAHTTVTKVSNRPGVNVFVYFQLLQVFILLTVCLGSYWFYKKKTRLETSCDARKDGTKCYGALGGTVYLQLIINASGHELEFKNNITGTNVFKLENGKVKTNPPLKHRAVFYVEDGMLMLSNTEKADYGKYDLNIYNSEGMLLNTRQLDLLLLSSECLSQEEMRVTCSFEGTVPSTAGLWTDRH